MATEANISQAEVSHCMHAFTEPLIAIVNTFIKLKEGEIYKEKEQIVSTLSKLI